MANYVPTNLIHGHTRRGDKSPEYIAWSGMRQRCLNPRSPNYKYYGARGITIDPRWSKFENFLADMGPKPSLLHTLERLHNNGVYNKFNCIWATRQVQSRNNRRTKLTKALADDIRRLYATGKFTQATLASKFGVPNQYISSIVNNKAWR